MMKHGQRYPRRTSPLYSAEVKIDRMVSSCLSSAPSDMVDTVSTTLWCSFTRADTEQSRFRYSFIQPVPEQAS
jgi:hypothetical protein